MICKEISPVQRLRALVCLCMRMAPPLRLVKPSQRGSLHLNKQNMVTIERGGVRAPDYFDLIVSSRSLSRTRWTPNAKEGWDAFFMGVLCLGSESKQTVGKNFLSVDGSQVLLQKDSCFPLAALKAGFATTHEACQVFLPALLKFPI